MAQTPRNGTLVLGMRLTVEDMRLLAAEARQDRRSKATEAAVLVREALEARRKARR